MDQPPERVCPGCGIRLPVSPTALADRPDASPECWQCYGELCAYTFTRGDDTFIHQLAVDAYAAQHAGPHARPIGVAFALIGLYLACERGYGGRQVQHMHTLLARRSKDWPQFAAPAGRGTTTIVDVLGEKPGADRDAALRRWGRSVWEAWRSEHERVRDLVDRVMADS